MSPEKWNEFTKKSEDYWASDQSKIDVKKLVEKINRQEAKTNKRNVELSKMSETNFLAYLNSVYEKYSNEKYISSELKKGREPMCPKYSEIYSFLESYAHELDYARVLKGGKWISSFNQVAYKISRQFIVRLLIGQGSVIQVIKL